MNPLEKLRIDIPEIEKKLGYAFGDKELLTLAFTHRSFVNENRKLTTEQNERIEFLGDAILGLIISDFLYHKLPKAREGNLSHLRASIVDAPSCVSYIKSLGVSKHSLMSKGEMQNEGRGRESIEADLFEAIIGAIYLDGGLGAARAFFIEHFEDNITEMISKPQKNWKALLQDYSQRKFGSPPQYDIVLEEGPDHLKIFTISVTVGGSILARGTGSSKKLAEQDAAKIAIESMEKV